MLRRNIRERLGIGASTLSATLLLSAGNAAAAEGWEGDDSPLRLEAVVPLWLPFLGLETTIESDSTVGENIKTETEVAWIVIGSLELGYKALAARADAFGIGFEDTVLRRDGMETEVMVESSGFVARGILMYEFGPWRIRRNKPAWQFSVSPLAGARYNRIGLGTGERTEIEGDYSWTDPVVGTRMDMRLDDWRFGTHLDIGGFGVSSDLAFWAAATVDYMITSWFSVWLGWQHYQVYFEEASEEQVDTLELFLTGPSAGVSFHIL
ncbi:MAG TPA: hypothetical protein VFU02_07105 [Polyangiaceae bacterium]|nr:hypothetical protein [Polyangiaceae bacterium]